MIGFFSKAVRNFARQVKKPEAAEKRDYESLVKNKEFLQMIGIAGPPISQNAKFENKFVLYSETGKEMGVKTLQEAFSIANSLKLDLVFVEEDSSAVQMMNFHKVVLKTFI